MKKNSERVKSVNLPVTKQTAGAVTGAVVGSVIAGPVGAIVGGVAGAVMGSRVEQGKPAIPKGTVAAATSLAKKVQRSPGGKKVKAFATKAIAKAKKSGRAVVRKAAAQTSSKKSGNKRAMKRKGR